MLTKKATYSVGEVRDIFKMILFTSTKLRYMPRAYVSFGAAGLTEGECKKISQDIKEFFDIETVPELHYTWLTTYLDIIGQMKYEGRINGTSTIEPAIIEPEQTQQYTTHQIYNTLLCRLGNVMKRKIDTDQMLGAIMYYAELDKTGKQTENLTKEFRAIQDIFNIKIYASYTLDDLASLIEWSLSGYGKLDKAKKQMFTAQHKHQK